MANALTYVTYWVAGFSFANGILAECVHSADRFARVRG